MDVQGLIEAFNGAGISANGIVLDNETKMMSYMLKHPNVSLTLTPCEDEEVSG
jgi:ApbE superfamily uncharacterized protein (UPF0280 family)